jgi:hypothetical protein
MHLDRIFSMCPYLTGSPEGVVCNATFTLLRNIEDSNPDICISRHFEVCHLYIAKLHEIAIMPALAANESSKTI